MKNTNINCIFTVTYYKRLKKKSIQLEVFMRIFLIFAIILTFSCASKDIKQSQVIEKSPEQKTEYVEKKEDKKENPPVIGWIDKDTYTVQVIDDDLDKAKNAARHKILQDIVKVRILNGSVYTDITKISSEFDKPLKEGKVISQRQINGKIEIYFQIQDKDLKSKFERK